MFDKLPALSLQKRYKQREYPLSVVVAIIRRTNTDNTHHYLLIQRNSKPYLGLWALVGGKWDFGETLAQAVVREVQEETGLATRFVALRGVVNELVAPATEANEGSHFLMFVCEVDVPADGVATEQHEGAVAWFLPAEVEVLHQNKQIIPSDYAMLHQFSESEKMPYAEVKMVAENAGTKIVDFEMC